MFRRLKRISIFVIILCFYPNIASGVNSTSDGYGGTEYWIDYQNRYVGGLLPPYIWATGCGPTSAAMALGYWDNYGSYDNTSYGGDSGSGKYISNGKLIESYVDSVTVESCVAAGGGGNYQCDADYVPYLVIDLANAMNCSASGSTLPSDQKYGINSVTNNRGYGSNWATLYTSDIFDPTCWTILKNEINNNRPCKWGISYYGDGHAVCAWGYTEGGYYDEYVICYNTWDEMRHDYPCLPSGDITSLNVVTIVPQNLNSGQDVYLKIPDGGQYWEGNTTQTIQWYQWGNSIDNIDIYYSSDSGYSWNIIETGLSSTADSYNSYDWTIPNSIDSSRVMVKIEGWQETTSHFGTDGSKENFTINPGVDTSSPPAPIVTSSTHKEGVINTTNNDPVFEWTVPYDVSGIDGFSFELNHTEGYIPDTVKDCEESITSKQYTDVGDGVWYFHIRAKDNADNWGDTFTYGPIKIDMINPTFTNITSSKDPAKEGDITITAVASEELSEITVKITQNGKTSTQILMASTNSIIWTGNYTVTSSYDGTAVINVSGKDLGGNTGSGEGNFTVDTTLPTNPEITSSHPEDYPFSNDNPSFNWTISTDSLSGIAGYSYILEQVEIYSLDTTVETTETSVSFTKSDGTYWFYVRAVDNAGNGSEIAAYKVIIDTTSPTLTVTSSKNPAKEEDITITVQADEKLEIPTVMVKQDNQVSAMIITMGSSDDITWTGTYTVVTGYDGTAVINVNSSDLADNVGTASGAFEVDTIPPTVSISVSPGSPLGTGSVEVTLTVNDAGFISQAPELNYTLSEGSPINIPLIGSDKDWTGTFHIESTTPEGIATLSCSIVDDAGNRGTSITSGETFEIEKTISASEGGTISNSDGTKAVIPPNILPPNTDVNVYIIVGDTEASEIKNAQENAERDKGIKVINTDNTIRDFSVINDATGETIINLYGQAAITIPYKDDDQNGIVDGTDIDETILRLFYLNQTNGRWSLIKNSQVNIQENTVFCEVEHFSSFCLMGYLELSPSVLDRVYNYPNPCYPKRCEVVNIVNLPLIIEITIYIYNIVGELVRTLKTNNEIEMGPSSARAMWNCKNEDGAEVASGIYIYVIETTEETKVGKKIVIIK